MTPKLLSKEELAKRLSRIEHYAAERGDGEPVNEALSEVMAHIAALLEDHRKALVRARNEGLEKAATRLADLIPETTIFKATRTVLTRAVANIRAMKEPEE